MRHKTRGIVLHQFKYDDKKRIITIYTEEFGRSTYIVANSKKNKINLFRPFYLLNLEVVHNPKSTLHKISEVSMEYNFKSIPYDFSKSAIALFLSEMLYKILKEESSNHQLFEFLISSIKLLDEQKENINSFHIVFLNQLTCYLGFQPEQVPLMPYFDMIEGIFCSKKPEHKHFLVKADTEIFYKSLCIDFNQQLSISKNEKICLLKNIIEYYKIHFESIGEVKSLDVLIDVFNQS